MESEELDFVQEHKKIPVTLDLTQCDDAISRQEAIEAFQIFREYESNRSNKEWIDRIETVLNQLPPVNPQPKTGHWIRWYEQKENDWVIENIPHCKCSECGKEYDPHSSQSIKYCNGCGAKMIDPRIESEEKDGL